MGFWSATKQANLKRGGVYLSDGVMHKNKDGIWEGIGTQHRYKLKLLALKMVEGRGTSGMVAEFQILESSFDKNPPGSNASFFANLSKIPEAGLRDAMLLVAALYGVDAADEDKVREVATEEMMEYVTSEENPLGEYGIELYCTTKAKLTKNDRPFNVHYFEAAINPPVR